MIEDAVPDVELAETRHQWLLQKLRVDRRIATTAAADALGVSVDTVRRDLRALADRGLLRRVHGGAVPVSPLGSSFAERQAESAPARARLAEAVAARFRSGQIVGLDAGTTTTAIAGRIPIGLELTVITNNPMVPPALVEHRGVEVVLLGGEVDLTWMATVGPDAVDAWRRHRVDVGVVGVCGFDPDSGLSTRSRAEVATKRALVEAAAEVVVPVEADKLGVEAPYLVAGVDSADVLVIDDPEPAAELTDRTGRAGVELVPVGSAPMGR